MQRYLPNDIQVIRRIFINGSVGIFFERDIQMPVIAFHHPVLTDCFGHKIDIQG